MRTEQEMMELIMRKAIADDCIRAVILNGSRANPNSTKDKYSDFDIIYVVTEVKKYTKDKRWLEYFGDILILQTPMDDYDSPYDYESNDRFAFLIQFTDGNRIDLTIMHIKDLPLEEQCKEPRIVLLNKDNYKELTDINSDEVFHIYQPSEFEFQNTVNEFRWISLYIAKGLCRDELYYVKYHFDVVLMKQFIKMLDWKIGIKTDFTVSVGSHEKYLKRFLSEDEMLRFQSIFPNGDSEDIWKKLFVIYDYFAELEEYVGSDLGFTIDTTEVERVKVYLIKQYEEQRIHKVLKK